MRQINQFTEMKREMEIISMWWSELSRFRFRAFCSKHIRYIKFWCSTFLVLMMYIFFFKHILQILFRHILNEIQNDLFTLMVYGEYLVEFISMCHLKQKTKLSNFRRNLHENIGKKNQTLRVNLISSRLPRCAFIFL